MKPIVFLPVEPDQARALRSGTPLGPGPAYAATPALCATFEYAAGAEEDADFAAQVFASLRCLSDGRDRLLLAAEVTALPPGDGEAEFGGVVRPSVRWSAVRAIFTDEPASLPAARAYADAARGRALADLWGDDATHDFLEHHHLLWFDPTELDQALAEAGEPPMKGD